MASKKQLADIHSSEQVCPKCGKSTARGHVVSQYGEVIFCYEDLSGEEPTAQNKKRFSHSYQAFLKERSNNKVDETSTGYKLRQAMKDNGYTMQSTATKSGVSYATIQRMCSGDQIGTLAAWVKVSKAIGVSIQDLVEE